MASKQIISREAVMVVAVNDFNRPFGIEKDKTYAAEKVTTEYTQEFRGSYNVKTTETWQSISWTIGAYNYQGDDFKVAA